MHLLEDLEMEGSRASLLEDGGRGRRGLRMAKEKRGMIAP